MLLGLEYSEKIDVWAIGTILACMILGGPSFFEANAKDKLLYIIDRTVKLMCQSDTTIEKSWLNSVDKEHRKAYFRVIIRNGINPHDNFVIKNPDGTNTRLKSLVEQLNIVNSKSPSEENKKFTDLLVNNMLVPNPQKRATFEKIKEIINKKNVVAGEVCPETFFNTGPSLS